LDWFNALGDYGLSLEYEGPGLSRRRIPDAELACKTTADGAGGGKLIPGLHYAAYLGENWYALPDFALLKPVSEGLAANFDLSHRARDEQAGLEFTGLLHISQAGTYTFHLGSDDGSQLYVGAATNYCRVIRLGRRSAPRIASIDQVLQKGEVAQWGRIEGVVSFAGREHDHLELELAGDEPRGRITVLNNPSLAPATLWRRRITAVGVCRGQQDGTPEKNVHAVVLDAQGVEFSEADVNASDSLGATELTTAAQVKRLKPAEAARKIRATLRGVVIWASGTSVVIQDHTGGVFVHGPAERWEEQPKVGELWELQGRTDSGDFSPVMLSESARCLGTAAMPIPTEPSWAQLMNGSMDAEYVEIRALITGISTNEVSILTPDGELKIVSSPDHPLPAIFSEARYRHERAGLLDSVVRVRGCLTAIWDSSTRQVKAGEIQLTPAMVEVEDSGPADPFGLPTKNASDLLRFDAQAGSLQRTKISGQVTCARPPEYYLADRGVNVRLLAQKAGALSPGDWVEAVGFPQLSRVSPTLREAQVKVTGHAPLPTAISLLASQLPDWKEDGAIVEVEATLLSDAMQANERTLELQAGRCHFLATLPMERSAWRPLPAQSKLQLTGIFASSAARETSGNLDFFSLLLNRPEDVVVLQRPSWWTARHALSVIAVLVAVLGAGLMWIAMLRREVAARTRQWQKEMEDRKRAEQIRALEQERTRVAQDLHDELGIGLTQVSMLGALAKNPALSEERKIRYLDQLTAAAHSLVTGLDEIVWAVNPQYDSAASLATYYSLFAQRFLNLAGIACRFESGEGLPELPMDSRIRHGVFLAFKESLNNIVRHSKASEVRLKIAIDERGLVVVVTDNGVGFSPADQQPGADGMANMQRRMEKLGGGCAVTSQPGGGTTVELRLPLNHKPDRL
jgi:signal transduction histidine kinase